MVSFIYELDSRVDTAPSGCPGDYPSSLILYLTSQSQKCTGLWLVETDHMTSIHFTQQNTFQIEHFHPFYNHDLNVVTLTKFTKLKRGEHILSMIWTRFEHDFHSIYFTFLFWRQVRMEKKGFMLHAYL